VVSGKESADPRSNSNPELRSQLIVNHCGTVENQRVAEKGTVLLNEFYRAIKDLSARNSSSALDCCRAHIRSSVGERRTQER